MDNKKSENDSKTSKDAKTKTPNIKKQLDILLNLFTEYAYLALPLVFLIPIIVIIENLSSLGMKNSLTDPTFKIGLYIGVWGFATAIVSAIQFNIKLKNLKKEIFSIIQNSNLPKIKDIQNNLNVQNSIIINKTKFLKILFTLGIIFFSILGTILLIETGISDIQVYGYFNSGFSFSNFVNPKYVFVSPILLEKDLITIPIALHFPNGTVTNTTYPLNSGTKIIFESTALSAQNPIKIFSELNIKIPDNMPIKLQNQYFMVFPFSQDVSMKYDKFEQTTAFITLNRITENQFRGNGTIMYPSEGIQPFFNILTWDELQKNRLGDTAYHNPSDIQYEVDGKPFLIIEPSSTTTLLRTNIIIVALTFVVIAFGLEQIRKKIGK